jgi:hypothetical protein
MARKLIDLAGIAELLQVSPVTPPQWRQRSRRGELDPPLPEPDEPTITDKPLWYEDTIIDWAMRTDRWPPGRAARLNARGSRQAA